jgi:hypothetical protein
MLSRLAAALVEKKRSIAITKSAVSQHVAKQRDRASLRFFLLTREKQQSSSLFKHKIVLRVSSLSTDGL